ncbi:MAG: rhomboid family intramembrane serine protease [Lachnospiraceae bacterium]|nr:rhomboid family intramembrane serine protease [Lachnospiraceae bacterium]
MISRYGQILAQMGYDRVILNISNCQLFCAEKADGLAALVLFDCMYGSEFTSSQAESILFSVHDELEEQFQVPVLVQGIIFTEHVTDARKVYTETGKEWIADVSQSRLIRYDEVPNALKEEMEFLESLLIHDNPKDVNGTWYAQKYEPEQNRKFWENWVPPFRLTAVNTSLFAINVVVFIVCSLVGSTESAQDLYRFGGLYYPSILLGGEYYRLISYMFLHSGISHIFGNMLVLSYLGDNLEKRLGKWKYLTFYLTSGVIAGAVSMYWDVLHDTPVVGVGASGAIFAVIGALIYILARNKGHLEDLSIYRLTFFSILSLVNGFASEGIDNVAHLAGFLAGFLLGVLFYRKQKV